MRCPSCGFDNPEGLKFCNDCGTPLRMPCAQCGFANRPQAKFCGACGAALLPQAGVSSAAPVAPRPHTPLSYTPTHLAEKILTSKTALEGERKQVTMLFADLKGSMELLADRDPEEARQLLDPVLERMMAAVHHYEGTVNQVMGDGIMALFGPPIAHEDHAVRACYAALAMQDTMRRYSEEMRRTHGIEVQIRVGLNSGAVVVRAIDSRLHMDYTAVGQTTHLAARMEQLATPGSIRLTAETLRWAEGFVRVNALGPVPVKGLPEDEQVERLAQHAMRGEVWEKALAYNRHAGEKAWARSAYREAVACYKQALVALEHLPDSRAAAEQAIDLRLGLRGALTALGEAPGRLLDHLGRAEAWALWLLGESTTRQASPAVESAAGHYHQALALADGLGMRPLQAHCHLGLGTLDVKIGRAEQARAELSTAVEMYRAMDMTFWLPRAEAMLAQVEGR